MGAKRQLTEEQLEKLKLAREKAMKVRMEKAAKLNEIKRLEKEAAEKEINDKLERVKSKVTSGEPKVPHNPSSMNEERHDSASRTQAQASLTIKGGGTGGTLVPSTKKPKRSKAEIIKSVVEEESEDSESDSDEEESVVNPVKTFLKEKYRQKYKQRYESKHLNNLVKHSAHNHLRSRIDEEVFRLAQAAMFS